jgi:hypothetical protein
MFSSRLTHAGPRFCYMGGDRTGRWQAWYAEAIPKADRLYDEYLEELRREGLI